jgi:hypothetical protein
MRMKLYTYAVRIVLTGRVRAEDQLDATQMLDYEPGGLDVHEVEVERIEQEAP